MRKENYVSLWLANFKSKDILDEYIDYTYDEEEEYIPSYFENNFKIDFYDEDFIEVNFLNESSSDIELLLKDHSYSNVLIPLFKNELAKMKTKQEFNTKEFNTIILLYEFNYNGSVKKSIFKNNEVLFISSIKYN